MDLVFWIPWAIGVVIFVLWVKHPISEFRQLLKDKSAQEQAESEERNQDMNESK